MGIEYRDRAGRQRRHHRRTKREEDRWASLAGPVEVRRLDDDTGARAEDRGAAARTDRAAPLEDQDQG